MDQAQFDTITTFLRNLNASGNLGSADLDVLKNAILGVFTNTYTPGYIGKTQEQLLSDYAPTLITANQTGDPFLRQAAEDVEQGIDLWTVELNLRRLLNEDPDVSADSALVDRYMRQAATYYREYNAYKKAEREDVQAKIDNDPFRKVGLSGFEDRYDPTQVFAEDFARTAQRFADKRKEAATKSSLKNTSEAAKNTFEDAENTSKSVVEVNPKTIKTNTPVEEKSNELINAENAFKKFVAENPDTYDLEYQTLLTARDNARQRYSAGVVDAVGFTGAPNTKNFKTSDMLESLASGETKEKTKTIVPTSKNLTKFDFNKFVTPNMKQKGITASGLGSDAESYVMAEMARLLALKLEQEGRTPLKDELTTRGLFAQAAVRPKSSKSSKSAKKNYTVKGSNVIKLGS